MSDTPKTDNLERDIDDNRAAMAEMIGLARQLERENGQLRSERDEYANRFVELVQKYDEQALENSRLRAANKAKP